jgi:hypothetical protein
VLHPIWHYLITLALVFWAVSATRSLTLFAFNRRENFADFYRFVLLRGLPLGGPSLRARAAIYACLALFGPFVDLYDLVTWPLRRLRNLSHEQADRPTESPG